MEVDLGEGEDAVPEMITCLLEVGDRRVDQFLKRPADIEVDDRVYILLDLFPGGARLGKDIGIIITA
jgi:hypothetical protein